MRTATLATIACGCCWLACVSPWTADAASASGPLKWSAPLLIDHATAPAKPAVLFGLSCPGGGLCVGVGPSGQVQSSLDPASAQAWHGATIDSGATLEGVACPSTTLCVAVSSGGDLLSSVAPSAGTWSTAAKVFSQPGAGLGGVACATASLCVAVDGASQIATSTDPASGVWSVTTVPGEHQLDSVACPSLSLCVIADFDGAVLTATNPVAGASAYTSTDLSGDVKSPEELFTLLSLSCGSTTECVASDDNGDLLATNDPAGGASAWSAAHVDGVNQLNSVSCVGSGLCVAADAVGNVFASTGPNGTKQSWTATDNVDPSGFDAVVCQSATLCLAGAADGTVAVSQNPSAAPPTWSHTTRLGFGSTRHPALVAISCPGASSCVALDGAGNLLSTGRPAGNAAGWSSRALNPGLGAADSISCAAGGSCVAIGPQSHVAVGAVRGGGAWKLANLNLFSIDDNGVDSPDSLGSISCASRTLCVATDFSDGVGSAGLLEISRDPVAGSWGQASLGSPDFDFFTAISCPSNRLCVAGDGQGDRFAVSTSAGRDWRFVNAGSGEGVTGVSCPTSSFCAAVDQSGDVLTTTDPSGGRRAWHHVRIEHRSLTAIACASRSLCVAIDRRDHVLVSAAPGGAASSWKSAALGSGLTGVTCPSSRLCVITTDAGTVRLGRLHMPARDAAAVSAKPLPDVTALIGRATSRVRATDKPQFQRDVLYEADGSTRGGKPVSSAAGVVSWKFVFRGTPGTKYASANLTYGPAPKGFGKVIGIKQPFLEDVPIPRAPTMTLAQAVARLRRAGYRQGFSAVTLRNPLGPKRSNPLYIFTLAPKFVGVNTVTGKVSGLS